VIALVIAYFLVGQYNRANDCGNKKYKDQNKHSHGLCFLLQIYVSYFALSSSNKQSLLIFSHLSSVLELLTLTVVAPQIHINNGQFLSVDKFVAN